MKQRLDRKTMKITDSKHYYIALVLALSLSLFVGKVVSEIFPNAPVQLSTRAIEITFFIIALFTVRNTRFIQPGLGLKIEKNKRTKKIVYIIIVIAVCLLILFLGRIIGQTFIPGMAERPYFGLYLDMPKRQFFLLVVFIQETLSKAVLQYGLEQTVSKDNWKIAVLLCGSIFGMLHIFYSSIYMILAFIFGIVSGIYYHYQKDIWIPIAIHFVFGFFVRSFGLII